MGAFEGLISEAFHSYLIGWVSLRGFQLPNHITAILDKNRPIFWIKIRLTRLYFSFCVYFLFFCAAMGDYGDAFMQNKDAAVKTEREKSPKRSYQ